MRGDVSDHPNAPLQLGCRAQALYVFTFVLLFLLACWFVGSLIAQSA